jgi:16S rRNA (adenine(1408)-N(1))-methyltransferase
VAIDAEATRMRKVAQRLKGRAPANLFFWMLSMDEGLHDARGLFDEIHVILPWGSLLEGMLGLNEPALGHVLDLGRRSARLIVVLNCRPWRQGHGDLRTSSLPSPADAEVRAELTRLLAARGWDVCEWSLTEDGEARKLESSWARRLASSQAPEFVRFEAVRSDGVK